MKEFWAPTPADEVSVRTPGYRRLAGGLKCLVVFALGFVEQATGEPIEQIKNLVSECGLCFQQEAGLPAHYSPHSFRATGITNFLENDGTLEAAQRIAGHADSRTTKLYDRRGQKVLLEDMERIRY